MTRPKATSKIAGQNHPMPQQARLPGSARREQLIQVAVDLFSRKGFKGTTTREIATAAGVTEAIIFRHFETKELLYTAIIDQKVDSSLTAKWAAGLRSAMDRNDDEAVIRQLISAIICTHKTDPKFERLMLYAALEGNEVALLHLRQLTASILDLFRSYFLRRQKQGRLSAQGADAALMAIVGMAQYYARTKYIHESKEHCVSDEEAIESFTCIALDGLRVQPRRKISGSAKKR